MIKIALIILTIVYSNLFTNRKLEQHPVHVTVTNIEKTEQQKKIEIILRVYTDDLLLAVNNFNNNEIALKEANKITDIVILDYLTNNLIIKINKNKKHSKYKFVKKINTELETFFYFEYNAKQIINNIEIENKLMINVYNDQTNLLILTINNQQKTFSFNNLMTKQRFDFN